MSIAPVSKIAAAIGVSPAAMSSPALQPALVEMKKADAAFQALYHKTPSEERRANAALMTAAQRRRAAVAAVHALLAGAPVLVASAEAETGEWDIPADCRDTASCSRHGACMYLGCSHRAAPRL
jgi:hypothetical protein